MASSYRVNLLDVLRTQANSEAENRKRVLRVYGGLMAHTHLIDICAAVALVACYSGFEVKAALRPFTHWDFAFGHKVTDVVFMAVARAIVFPVLTRLAIRCGRPPYDGCFCAKKPAAPEGYAALEGAQTGAATAAALSAELADDDRRTKKARAALRKHAILGLLFVLATGMQVYVGVKINGFAWGPPANFAGDRVKERRHTKTAQILLVCAGVLFTNISLWLARELVRELTRDDGLYLPDVHAHPLVYDATLSRHWCDLCSTPIRRGGAWRCKLCDFDRITPCPLTLHSPRHRCDRSSFVKFSSTQCACPAPVGRTPRRSASTSCEATAARGARRTCRRRRICGGPSRSPRTSGAC